MFSLSMASPEEGCPQYLQSPHGKENPMLYNDLSTASVCTSERTLEDESLFHHQQNQFQQQFQPQHQYQQPQQQQQPQMPFVPPMPVKLLRPGAGYPCAPPGNNGLTISPHVVAPQPAWTELPSGPSFVRPQGSTFEAKPQQGPSYAAYVGSSLSSVMGKGGPYEAGPLTLSATSATLSSLGHNSNSNSNATDSYSACASDEARPSSAFDVTEEDGTPTLQSESQVRELQDMVMNTIDSGSRPDRNSFNMLIHACSSRGDVQMAEHWLETMMRVGMKPSGVSYASVINACAQGKDPLRAEQWLSKMVKSGMVPNQHCFNAVINACAKAGFVDRAESWVLAAKKDAGLFHPNVVSYNTLINAHARAGNVSRAEFWLREMVKAHLVPNEVSLGSVINACAEAEDVEKAEMWLQVMLTESWLEPNEVSYNAVIKACVKAGNIEKAEHWVNRMSQDGITMTPVTYNLIISACAQSGDVARAEGYLAEMLRRQIPANKITYNTVINTCATKGETRRAEMWINQMSANGINPDVVSYGALCKAYAREGSYNKVNSIIESLDSKGLKANEYFYASLIGACSAARPPQPGLAERAFRQCIRKGYDGAPLVRVLRRALGWERCMQLCKEMRVPLDSAQDKRGNHNGNKSRNNRGGQRG